MKQSQSSIKRIIGLDMHPDVFSAAALEQTRADTAHTLWTQDRQLTAELEIWAGKHLSADDTLVLEASANSFEVAHRLQKLGYTCLVLESAQAAKIRANFCNDDRQSAIKLARVYLCGLAKIVWQPDEDTRQMRDIFFAHQSIVKDSTRARNRIRSYLNEYCVRLPKGVSLSNPEAFKVSLQQREWNTLQREILAERFEQLKQTQYRRIKLEQVMARELLKRPQWSKLWRLMGIRHIVAFGLMAIIGDINRFPTAKHLVGYLGLSPRKDQSGNNAKGYDRGIGNTGRGDVRALLVQSAQNALNQKGSPLHQWGWKLALHKDRKLAVAAVARKLAVAIWHLLKGHFTPLLELSPTLETKLKRMASLLGNDYIREQGFQKRQDFVLYHFKQIQISP